MPLSPDEVMHHVREECRTWAMLPGNDATPEEAEQFADEQLAKTMAQIISSMTYNIEYVEGCLDDHHRNQLYSF